jgi:hypothetical protein
VNQSENVRSTNETKSRFLSVLRTASEVAHAAILTWVLFLVLQAVALHFVVEGF